jgi:hypothetical protein
MLDVRKWKWRVAFKVRGKVGGAATPFFMQYHNATELRYVSCKANHAKA